MLTEFPKIFELFNWGLRKPDCLSTVGSGWKNFENIKLGYLDFYDRTFIIKLFLFLSWVIFSAWIDHGGQLSVFLQLVNIPLLTIVLFLSLYDDNL